VQNYNDLYSRLGVDVKPVTASHLFHSSSSCLVLGPRRLSSFAIPSVTFPLQVGVDVITAIDHEWLFSTPPVRAWSWAWQAKLLCISSVPFPLQVGVDVITAIDHKWLFSSLQFVTGLGPWKAKLLCKSSYNFCFTGGR
jgi:hypothetical protein